MCAWQRLASEPQDSAAVSLLTSSVPETLSQSRAGHPCPSGRGREGVQSGEGQARHSGGLALNDHACLLVSAEPLQGPSVGSAPGLRYQP